MKSRLHPAVSRMLCTVWAFAIAVAGCASPDALQPQGSAEAPTAMTPGFQQHYYVDQQGNVPLEPIDFTRVIVELVPDPTRSAGQIALAYGLTVFEQISQQYFVFQGGHDVAALRADPDVAAADVNSLVESHGSDFVFGFYEGDWDEAAGTGQEAISSLNLEQLHLIGRGTGVRVLVADTGVDPEHPYLAPHLELLDPAVHLLGSIEPAPADLGSAPAFGHGTHVAGCVLQVAPQATVVAARVLDHRGQGSLQDFVRALSAALDPALDIDIVNLSMSTATEVQLVHRMIDKLAARGTVVVAAAGNYEPGTSPPAPSPLSTYSPVVGVVAVDPSDLLTPFSRSGVSVDFAAPGAGIQSCYPAYGSQPAGYTTASGTSFATPLVSGAIACVMHAGSISAVSAVNQMRGDCVVTSPSIACQSGRVNPRQTALDVVPPPPSGGGGVRPRR